MKRSLYVATGQTEDLTGIAQRVANISVSAIKQMPVLAGKVEGALSLGQGIPSFNTPLFIREAVREALLDNDAIGKYSLQPGVPELKVEIAKRLQRTKGIDAVDPDAELVVTCGAMEGLAATISAIVERGDEVILLSPSYSSHVEQVLFAEGVPVFVPLVEEAGWALDCDAVRAAITPRTKAIVVCSPGNPTGSVFPESQLRELGAIALEHDLFVLADEAYDFLVYDQTPYFSLTSIAELRPKLIATYSFSKMFCMTGWRVGYLYASRSIVSQVLKVHDAFAICAPTISQYAALAGLRQTNGVDGEGDKAIAEITNALSRRRDSMCQLLDRMPGLFSYQKPQGAYYVFPSIVPEGIDSVNLALRLLHEARVITIPGGGFGPSGEGHIRLSFGADDAVITEAMQRIELWNEQQRF